VLISQNRLSAETERRTDLADLEMETKPEDVMAETERLQTLASAMHKTRVPAHQKDQLVLDKR
jgi:uncharacterized membrane protein